MPRQGGESMFRDAQAESSKTRCAACGESGAQGFWTVWLCDGCYGQWQREAPTLHSLEMAHADAHPEDVEMRGERAYGLEGEDKRWVILKPGVTERVAKDAARAWLSAQRKAVAA